MDDEKDLSPADKEGLRFLRSQVDRLQDERFRKADNPGSTASDLQRASRDLQDFVRELREKGRNI